ncbi:MAG: hypothetical protein Q9198_003325 [Flavoplaca austrocitrina]
MPDDLPGAQVWTYGYDSRLTASQSFQDLEALSSKFRRLLVSSRVQYTSADGVWSMTGPLSVLVDASSATHGRPGEDQAHHIQALNRNHSEMVKFGRKDVDYDIVLGFLKEFAKSASDIIRARFSLDGKLSSSAERQYL